MAEPEYVKGSTLFYKQHAERLRVKNIILAQERDQIRAQRDELISTLAELRTKLNDTES